MPQKEHYARLLSEEKIISSLCGKRAAAIYSLIWTCKLNGLDPEAYLRDVLGRIAEHPRNKIADLLPWNVAATLELLRLTA
jgi:IS66 C-terminal element